MLLQQDRGVPNMAGVLPLSLAQEGLWFFEQAAPGTPTYNLAEAWWLDGPLDVPALQGSLDELARRHESLRTAIGAKDGKPCQIVFPPRPFPLAIFDLRSHAEAETIARQEARKPFNLTQETLVRCALFRVTPERHLFLVTMHHIISDAWSVGIFLKELAEFYQYGSRRLPKPAIQYGNFAIWQREMARQKLWSEDLEYWKRQLEGAPPLLALPTDFPRPAAETHRGAALLFTWPETLAAALKELNRNEGSTTFRILLAAFGILLQRHTLQDDIVLGSPFAGRDEVETERLIGLFVNTVALRMDLSGDPPFRQLLRRVGESTLAASLHQHIPLHHVVRALGLERNMSAQPLFQAAIGWQKDFTEGWSLPNINATRLELDSGTSKFDLTVLVTETSRDLRLRLEYSTEIFAAATMELLARQFRALVEGLVEEPGRRISEFPLAAPEARRKWLAWGAGVVTEYERYSCVHELFEAQAARTPSSVALAWEDEKISYGELNRRANLLAARLAKAGAGAGAVVGICLERSMEMIVGLLGILKAGAAYLPLDPSNPIPRNAVMLKDAHAALVLTSSQLRNAVPPNAEKVLCIDVPDQPAEMKEGRRASATDAAYIMYTSGSTGSPKGVEVPHRAIARLIRNTDYVSITPKDIFLQLAPISFDASTFEIWGSLLNGAKLVVYPPRMPSLEELGRVIQREKVTTLWLTSSWFNQMVDDQLPSLRGLRFLLAGGEALSVPHVVKAVRELKDCQIINGYGPTETTTFACCYRIPKPWTPRASVPIGRPIANTRAYILDAARNLAPEGTIGELYIGGDGVARGYVNQPELTAEKFVASPFGQERLYRTGDLARWLPDGNIEFLGRKDDQLKIRGFRVEPGEIEAALIAHPAVREAIVLARPTPSGAKQLAGYVVLRSGASATNLQLREFLAKQLPSFMVPAGIVPLEKFPLTTNGKVNRRALPPLEDLPGTDNEPPAPPRNATETLLVEIWREILQRERVGIHDNFFHLGGHSLLATQIISRVARALRVELPVRLIFESPTIAAMAGSIEEHKIAAPPEIVVPADSPSRAQKLLERLDDLSDNEVEELLLELEEKEAN